MMRRLAVYLAAWTVACQAGYCADTPLLEDSFDSLSDWKLIHAREASAEGSICTTPQGKGAKIAISASAANQWIALYKAVDLSFPRPYRVAIRLKADGGPLDLQFHLEGTNKIRYTGLKRGILGGGRWQTVELFSDEIAKSWMVKGPAYPEGFMRVHLVFKNAFPTKATVTIDRLLIERYAKPAPALGFARIFSDHAVLQAGKKLKLWGVAPKGKAVTVSLGSSKATAAADASGRWSVTLPPMPCGGPHELSVAADGQEVTLKDIMIGEVWLASGQSNMAWPTGLAASVKDDYERAPNRNLRLFSVAPTPSRESLDELPALHCGWQIAGPQTVGDFSSLAYQFGRLLQDKRRVCVGVIDTSKGGSPVEAWLPQKVAESLKAGRPLSLYRGTIHPVVGYPLRGVIWYQGESNTRDPSPYADRFGALIRGWRDVWGEELPWLYVQLANFNPKKDDQKGNWPLLREAQAAALALPRTGMATAVDLGTPDDIHPRDKREVARRLVAAAQAVAYGTERNWASGPRVEKVEFTGKRAIIHLSGKCSRTAISANTPSGVEISADGKRFVPATVSIEGTTVTATAPTVPAPVAVRYGWADSPTMTLYDSKGYPVLPFRRSSVRDSANDRRAKP